MKKIIVIFILLFAYFFISPVFVFGQTTFQPQIGVGNEFPTTRATEVTGLTFAQYVIAFYTYMIRAIAIIAVAMIVVAGFKWMLSRGNASAITQAKDQMFSAIVGLILIVGANLILSFINPALVRFRSLNIRPISEIPVNEERSCPGTGFVDGGGRLTATNRCNTICGQGNIKELYQTSPSRYPDNWCCDCSACPVGYTQLPSDYRSRGCVPYCHDQGYSSGRAYNTDLYYCCKCF